MDNNDDYMDSHAFNANIPLLSSQPQVLWLEGMIVVVVDNDKKWLSM